jgi:hypothetical protein
MIPQSMMLRQTCWIAGGIRTPHSSLVPIYAYALFEVRGSWQGPVALVSPLLNTGLTLALEKDGITRKRPDYDDIRRQWPAKPVSGRCLLHCHGVVAIGLCHHILVTCRRVGFTSGAAIIIDCQIKDLLDTQYQGLTRACTSFEKHICSIEFTTNLLVGNLVSSF